MNEADGVRHVALGEHHLGRPHCRQSAQQQRQRVAFQHRMAAPGRRAGEKGGGVLVISGMHRHRGVGGAQQRDDHVERPGRGAARHAVADYQHAAILTRTPAGLPDAATAAMLPAVEVDALGKRFGAVTAVDELSLTVRAGEIFGLAGPNGAGKSTVLHMLLGLITPDAGRIRIFGQEFPRDRHAILSRMNVASPYASLPGKLTVWENLTIYAGLYGVREPRQKIAALLALMGVEHLRDAVTSRLSSGETSRVNLCKALLNDPELLLLDEPTAYLDPQIAGRVRNVVLERPRRRRDSGLYLAQHGRAGEPVRPRRLHGARSADRDRHADGGDPRDPARAAPHAGAERGVPARRRRSWMSPRRIGAVILRHLYETRRNVDRVADTIYWPVLDVVIWGFFTVYLRQTDRLHPRVGTILLGGVILWGMFRAFQRDLAVGFLAEIWSRNIVNLFASPLTIAEYLTGLVIVNFGRAALGTGGAIVVAWLCYAADLTPNLSGLAPFLGVLVVFSLAVGVATTALIFRYTTRIQTLAYSIAGVLMPLSCVFYPVRTLPSALRPFALALPTTHAFEGMRHVLSGLGVPGREVALGYGLAAVYFAGAIVLFRRVQGAALRHGHLVRLE